MTSEEDQEELAGIREATAGSLGCTLSEHDEYRYVITAGHVARPNPRHLSNELLAPASKPFVEVVKSVKANIDTVQRERVDKFMHLKRVFGETIVSSRHTEEQVTYRKIARQSRQRFLRRRQDGQTPSLSGKVRLSFLRSSPCLPRV